MTTVLAISIVILLLATDVFLFDICRGIRRFSAIYAKKISEKVEEKSEKASVGKEKSIEELEKEHTEKFKKEQDEAFGVMMNYDISTVYGVGSERR